MGSQLLSMITWDKFTFKKPNPRSPIPITFGPCFSMPRDSGKEPTRKSGYGKFTELTYQEKYFHSDVWTDAVLDKDTKKLEQLLLDGYSINRFNKYGDTALMMAAWTDDLDTAKWILRRGADRTLQNPNTELTVLDIAYNHGCPRLMTLLKQSSREEALHDAVQNGSVEKVEVLLQQGDTPNGEVNLLALALTYKKLSVAEVLIKFGADLNRNTASDNHKLSRILNS